MSLHDLKMEGTGNKCSHRALNQTPPLFFLVHFFLKSFYPSSSPPLFFLSVHLPQHFSVITLATFYNFCLLVLFSTRSVLFAQRLESLYKLLNIQIKHISCRCRGSSCQKQVKKKELIRFPGTMADSKAVSQFIGCS